MIKNGPNWRVSSGLGGGAVRKVSLMAGKLARLLSVFFRVSRKKAISSGGNSAPTGAFKRISKVSKLGSELGSELGLRLALVGGKELNSVF
jgi:hypothetical protein